MGATASPRSQRRRAEIVDAASTLFAQHGYHRVGMDEVAASVGITGGAIYKHFRGKQDLLERAIDGALVPTESAIDGAADLRDAIERLAEVAVEHPRVGLLLTREVRALDGEAGTAIRNRIDVMRTALAGLISERRPDLAPIDARLLSDAVLALLCSPSHHVSALARPQILALLEAMVTRIADAELPAATEAGPALPTRPRTTTLVDRRDLLIDAAIELFGQRGYWAATMDDLGAAADITGPSIYQHFSSKADLLVAVFTRGNEGLRLGLSRALAEGADAADSLRLLADSYVDFVQGHPEVNRLLISEALYLPELERASIRGMQQRYVREWVNLLQEAHPDIDQQTARFITHAVLSVVNNRGTVASEHAGRLHAVLATLTRDLLLTPRWAEVAP